MMIRQLELEKIDLIRVLFKNIKHCSPLLFPCNMNNISIDKQVFSNKEQKYPLTCNLVNLVMNCHKKIMQKMFQTNKLSSTFQSHVFSGCQRKSLLAAPRLLRPA